MTAGPDEYSGLALVRNKGAGAVASENDDEDTPDARSEDSIKAGAPEEEDPPAPFAEESTKEVAAEEDDPPAPLALAEENEGAAVEDDEPPAPLASGPAAAFLAISRDCIALIIASEGS